MLPPPFLEFEALKSLYWVKHNTGMGALGLGWNEAGTKCDVVGVNKLILMVPLGPVFP